MRSILEWKENLSPQEWDLLLSQYNVHPLQSSLWSEARKQVFGASDQHWVLYDHGELLGFIRFETRHFMRFGKIAWAPQADFQKNDTRFKEQFLKRLKNKGYSACAINPYAVAKSKTNRQTIFINLMTGRDVLWKNLDKQWRYGARLAQKQGVVVDTSEDCRDVELFNGLCETLERNKKFSSKNRSVEFFTCLLKNSTDKKVGAKLFIAKKQGEFCAGALIFYSGKNLHYMWGGVDRRYSKERVGEFIQWSVMEWGCEHGFERYDLEGIDEINNPGVASFKKKMGGEIVNLQSSEVYGLTLVGKLLSRFLRKRL